MAAGDLGTAVALVQEPYVGATGMMKQVPGAQIIQCSLNRQKPVKAAIIVFGGLLRVTHDPQQVTENVSAVLVEAGRLKLGMVSLYYEGNTDIDQYLQRTLAVCKSLERPSTRKYNTKKANWSGFDECLRGLLEEKGLTPLAIDLVQNRRDMMAVMARFNLQQQLDIDLQINTLPVLMGCKKQRQLLLNYMETIIKTVSARNSTPISTPIVSAPPVTMTQHLESVHTPVSIGNRVGRIVRKNNRTIVLFPTRENTTAFKLVCDVLTAVANESSIDTPPRKISVDAMRVGYIRGEVGDLEGVLLASVYHEIVVYEDRGQDLGYLLSRNEHASTLPTTPTSGAERLQTLIEKEGTPLRESQSTSSQRGPSAAFGRALINIITQMPTAANKAKQRLKTLLSTPSSGQKTKNTLSRQTSDPSRPHNLKGSAVPPPRLRSVREPCDYAINSMIEFAALTEASLKDKTDVCREILLYYKRGTLGMQISARLLRDRLEEAGAAVYDSARSQVIMGSMTGSYMAAYGESSGFFAAQTEGTSALVPPRGDPLVVVAECTRVMLEGRILSTINKVAGGLLEVNWRPKNFGTPKPTPSGRGGRADPDKPKHRGSTIPGCGDNPVLKPGLTAGGHIGQTSTTRNSGPRGPRGEGFSLLTVPRPPLQGRAGCERFRWWPKPPLGNQLAGWGSSRPGTGSLGPIVPEISDINQIEYKFGDWLSRGLLVLGGPSLGSLGRARGELPGGLGKSPKQRTAKNFFKKFFQKISQKFLGNKFYAKFKTCDKRYCTETVEKCGHCGGPHRQDECEEKGKGTKPVCVNCKNDNHGDTGHNAFSASCPVRRKWDSIARARVAYN
ncbi:hypothetical protein ACJJTC_000179 [Scirpophaga incertulas]